MEHCCGRKTIIIKCEIIKVQDECRGKSIVIKYKIVQVGERACNLYRAIFLMEFLGRAEEPSVFSAEFPDKSNFQKRESRRQAPQFWFSFFFIRRSMQRVLKEGKGIQDMQDTQRNRIYHHKYGRRSAWISLSTCVNRICSKDREGGTFFENFIVMIPVTVF